MLWSISKFSQKIFCLCYTLRLSYRRKSVAINFSLAYRRAFTRLTIIMNVLTSVFIRHGSTFEEDSGKMLAFFTGYLLSTILIENPSASLPYKSVENRLRMTDTWLELVQISVDRNNVKTLTLTNVCFHGLICADPKQLTFSAYSSDFPTVNVTHKLWSVGFFGMSKKTQYHIANVQDVHKFLQTDHVKLPLTWYSDKSFDLVEMLRKFTGVLDHIGKTSGGELLRTNTKFFILGCITGRYDINSAAQVAFYHDNPDNSDETIFVVDLEVVFVITFSSQFPRVPSDLAFSAKNIKMIRIEQQNSDTTLIREGDKYSISRNSHVEAILDSLNYTNIASIGKVDMLNQALASLLIFSKSNNLSIPWYLMGQISGLKKGSLFAWSYYCLNPSSSDLTLSFSVGEPVDVFQTLVIMPLAREDEKELCETMSLSANVQLKPNIGRQTIHFASVFSGGNFSKNEEDSKSLVQVSTLPITMLASDFRERMSKFSLDKLVKHKDNSNYLQPCFKCLLYDPVYFLDKFQKCLPRQPEKIGHFLSALVGHIKLSTSSMNVHNYGMGIHIVDNDDLAYKHMLLHFYNGTKTGVKYQELPGDFDKYLSNFLVKNGRFIAENIAVNFIKYVLENQEFSFRAVSLKINEKNRFKVGQCIYWMNLNIISPRPSCNLEVYPDNTVSNPVSPVEKVANEDLRGFTFVNLTTIFLSRHVMFDGYQQKSLKVTSKIWTILNCSKEYNPKNIELIMSDKTTMLDHCFYFDLLAYSTNITTRVGHSKIFGDMVFKTIDLCSTLPEVCDKMNQDHLMLWLRSNFRKYVLRLKTNETDESTTFMFILSRMAPVLRDGEVGNFSEDNNFLFNFSSNIRRPEAEMKKRPSSHIGSLFVLTPYRTNLKLCLPDNHLSVLYDRDEFSKFLNMCIINDFSCETSSDLQHSVLTKVHLSGRLEAPENMFSNTTSIVSFGTDTDTILFYEINRLQCQETVVKLPYCTKHVRISDKGRFAFVSFRENSSHLCENYNITFEFEYKTSTTIIVDESINQVIGIKNLPSNKTQLCFTTRCLTILSTFEENQWSVLFPGGLSLRFYDASRKSLFITYMPSYYPIIDLSFHHMIIRLSRTSLNNQSIFVHVNPKTFTAMKTNVFYLNLNEKTKTGVRSRKKISSALRFIETDPDCELVVHTISKDTVVSIRAGQLYHDLGRFSFKTVNIEFSKVATITVDMNTLNYLVEDNQHDDDQIHINFERTGGFEFTMFVNRITDTDSHLIGIVIFFDVNNIELIPGRIRLYLKNQLLRFLPKIHNRFSIANIPVEVPLTTEIFVLSEDYTKFPCELETHFLLGGLSFLRVDDHLIMKNVNSNRTVNTENRFTLILLDFFVFPSSFQNITVHFRKQSVVLLN